MTAASTRNGSHWSILFVLLLLLGVDYFPAEVLYQNLGSFLDTSKRQRRNRLLLLFFRGLIMPAQRMA